MMDFLEKFSDHVRKMEHNFNAGWENHKSLVKYLQDYENSNLKNYAGSEYDNFLLFQHP